VPHMRREKGGEAFVRLLCGERGIILCKHRCMWNKGIYLRLIQAMVHRRESFYIRISYISDGEINVLV
jgi:hypothetical protein